MTLFTPNGQLLPLAQFREALAQGADPNAPWWEDTAGEGSKVPLLVAAQRHIHHLRALIAQPRIRTDVLDHNGASALIVALKYNHTQAIRPLISAGVSVDQPDCFDAAPLHFAVHAEGASPLRQLLFAGANPNAKGHSGRTPLAELLMAYTTNSTTIEMKARLLLSKGANPNLLDSHGRTALHGAAVSGYYHVVDALLEFGANPDLVSHEGLSALLELKSVRVAEPYREPYLRIAARLKRHNLTRLAKEGGACGEPSQERRM